MAGSPLEAVTNLENQKEESRSDLRQMAGRGGLTGIIG